MCTVVCRWHPGQEFAVQLLALRDERASRVFDLPGYWWPDHPDVVGGRDRAAGGSWCVSDVAAGVTAVVLNWNGRLTADAGAPSRGILPLLAVRHRRSWPDHLDPTGMAGFHVVLVSPEALVWWWWDGTRLERHDLSAGTHMFTPPGLVTTGLDERLTAGGAHLDDVKRASPEQVWGDWLAAVRHQVPSPDPRSLVVSRPLDDGDTYETVFGQLIAARPGLLRLDHLARPVQHPGAPWTTSLWPGP